MPRYFLDSSALFKRYYFGQGSDWIKVVCEPHLRPILYIADIAHIEVVRALRQKQREAEPHPSFIDAQVARFERHLLLSEPLRIPREYDIVPLAPSIIQFAAQLCNRYWDVRPHPLRSLDALQLASAVVVAATTPEEIRFVTSDRRLAAVAEWSAFM